METRKCDGVRQTLEAEAKKEVPAKHPSKVLSVAGLILAVLIFTYMGKAVPKNILLSQTDSVGHRLFYFKRHVDPKQLKKGDYELIVSGKPFSIPKNNLIFFYTKIVLSRSLISAANFINMVIKKSGLRVPKNIKRRIKKLL